MYKLMAQNAGSYVGGGPYMLAYSEDKKELEKYKELKKERDKEQFVNYMLYWIEKGKVNDVYA